MKTSKHLERRRIEAEMIARIYQEMVEQLDSEVALHILTRVIEKAAFEEGQAFRDEAEEPGVEHFATILNHWGDAMELEGLEKSADGLQFNVVRCHYIKLYEKIGLPQELVRLLSCARDAPFANGYGIEFERKSTLAEGASHCDFCYKSRGDG